jgi:hypothetical protein
MPILDTTAWGTSDNAPDAPVSPHTAKPKSGFLDGLAATWQRESIWVPSKVRPSLEYPDDRTFDYKSYDKSLWPIVAAARNKDHAEDLVTAAKAEQKNREITDNQSWVTGLAQEVIVGLSNPLNYIGAGAAKTVIGAAGRTALGAVVGTTATEAILQSQQVTRTAEESLMNIGGAAVFGSAFGAGGKAISNKLKNGTFGSETFTPSLTPLNEAMKFGEGGSVGAAQAMTRTMADSKVARMPEWMTRFAFWGDYSRSANQRLSTSSLNASRNAGNILLRQNLGTVENLAGKANEVPIEISVGQRFGTDSTRLMEADMNFRSAWFKKVEGGTYDSQAIVAELRKMDPSLPEDYKLSENSFDKVMKAYMADDTSFGSTMPEVVDRVKAGAALREQLDADKIDFGLADKERLIDIATGERLAKPDDTLDFRLLGELKKQRAELASELDTLKKAKAPKVQIDDVKSKIAAQDNAIEAKKAAVEKYKADWENVQPSSKTHKFAYEDGSHYLSRVFDKGRILGDRGGFIKALLDGWTARNPELAGDLDALDGMLSAANKAADKLLNLDDQVTLGDLIKNMDLPGNYTKGRTLSIDDRFLTNFTHDNVMATELHHMSQAVVDVELAKQGVKFQDLINEINFEFADRVNQINTEFGAGTAKASKEINKLGLEKSKDVAELEYAMRKLKRQAPPGQSNPFAQSSNEWLNRVNKVAGMAQLGGSAIPTSIGDVASIARNFGTARTLHTMLKGVFSADFRADIKANARQVGIMSELINKTVRDMHVNEMLNDSLDPNKGFKSVGLQRLDNGLDKAADVFSKVSLIEGWAKVTRTVASAASTQHIMDAATKGWSSLSKTQQLDFAKFYINEDTLNRIQKQLAKYADGDDVRFAAVEKWDDLEAARLFNASVYAHTEHALNIPSIGSGSTFMSETVFGRVFMRFKSFNNAAHESTFLASLQNRDVSRVVTGTANYAFWGMLSVIGYDMITGRDVSMEKYFGSEEAATKTGWKILTKSGYMATSQDAFLTTSKALGSIPGPIGEQWRSAFPEGLEEEIFPKFADATAAEKLLGPTYSYLAGLAKTAGGVVDGNVEEKDIHNIRTSLPGQNIGWLRRGIDYLESVFGGRPMDYNAGK